MRLRKYLTEKYNFKAKVYRDIPKIKLSLPEFKDRVKLSYQTQRGITLNRMNKKDFDDWIGNENVKQGKIKVYRGVPSTDNNFRNGDFVTTNKTYAYTYGSKVISKWVKLKNLRYITGHKKGNPELVSTSLQGVQPVELIYVEKIDNFNKAFKSFEYDKYIKYIGKI